MAAVTAFIARIRELLQKNPLARYGVVILVVVLAGYLVASRLFGGGGGVLQATPPLRPPTATPAPQPA